MKYSNTYTITITIILSFFFFLFSCSDEKMGYGDGTLVVEEGIPGTFSLTVGTDQPALHVVTRSATEDEKTISSLYVFVIDVTDTGSGAGHPVLSRKWFPDADAFTFVGGRLQVDIPSVSCSSVRIFAVANLGMANQLANNDEMLNAFHNAATEAELEKITAQLEADDNSKALVDRIQGCLPASGHFYCVHQNEGTADAPQYPLYSEGPTFALESNGSGSLTLKHANAGSGWKVGDPVDGGIWLHHLDARISFEVRLADGLPAGSYFKLKSWKVKNLHTRTYVHWQEDNAHISDRLGETPDLTGSYIVESPDEDGTGTVSSFTFYAFENRHEKNLADADAVKAAMAAEGYSMDSFTQADEAYVLREKKSADGTFKYAPANAAYVVLKGEFYNPKAGEGGVQQRAANVTYLIHLGYIGNGNMEKPATGNEELNKLNDYRILRNSGYKYKVTVRDVENIKLEAEQDGHPEKQPSAEGSVVDSDFDLQADAHYEQRLIMLNLTDVTENLKNSDAGYSYTVSTPFTSSPVSVALNDDGTDNRPLTLDDGWVHFAYLNNDAYGLISQAMYQRMQEGAGYGLPYTYTYDVNPGESSASSPVQLWTPLTLLKNLKAWIETYKAAINAGKEIINTNPNDPYIELDGKPFYLNRYFTVYIDEYYYKQNPVTGTTSNTLWTSFCNADDRTMSIFQKTYAGGDGHSSYTRSGLNIRQRSIQTLYSPGQTGQQLAHFAFGIEHTDEYGGSYNIAPKQNMLFTSYSMADNGLENTHLGLWKNTKLVEDAIGNYSWKGVYAIFPKNERTSEGSLPVYPVGKSSRYANVAALSRNRDNNRNGMIDPEEILWYVPSRKEMMTLYLGSFLMPDPLYQAKLEKNGKLYYVTSTCENTKGLGILLAEEGIAIGWMDGSGGSFSEGDRDNCYIRCARSLGTPASLQTDFPYTGGYVLEDLISVNPVPTVGDNAVNYTFTYNKYNTGGFRSMIDAGALGSHTLFQAAARPYRSFITAKTLLYDADNNLADCSKARSLCNGYSELADRSDKGSWRLPNASEALAMLLYITPASMWDSLEGQLMWSCTQVSGDSGYIGVNFVEQEMLHMSDDKGYVRCVRDQK